MHAPCKLRALCFVLQGALIANSGLVRAQSPASSAKVLLTDAVGPGGPKVSISEVTLAPGGEFQPQGTQGPAFIYVLEGKVGGQDGAESKTYQSAEGLRLLRNQA